MGPMSRASAQKVQASHGPAPNGAATVGALIARAATCHPTRQVYAPGGLCRACSQLEGRLHLGESGLPQRLAGVTQRGSPDMPAECPRCHTTPPAWRLIPRARPVYGSCILCGTDWFRTSRRVIQNDASREARSENGNAWTALKRRRSPGVSHG